MFLKILMIGQFEKISTTHCLDVTIMVMGGVMLFCREDHDFNTGFIGNQ